MCMGTHALTLLPVRLLKHSPFLISAFFVNHSLTAFGDKPKVSLSTSINTGFAPIYDKALHVATKVRAWVRTSSLESTPPHHE